jgi:hypothetical protein
MPRLRQAVFAVRDLDGSVEALRAKHGLGEPYADPAIEYFGLRNAVFPIGDTFLELVSPVADDTAAGRQIERQGGDCGYMAMVQVEDVAAARERARQLGVGEVFEVEFDDITEAHLHPAQIGGAIVSISEPRPASSWRWGGSGWEARSTEGSLAGLTVAVADAGAVAARWQEVAGGPVPVSFLDDPSEPGIVAVELELGGLRVSIEPGDIAP